MSETRGGFLREEVTYALVLAGLGAAPPPGGLLESDTVLNSGTALDADGVVG